MIDHASIAMSHGESIALARAEGVNDNMNNSHYHPFFELYYLESGKRYHMIKDQVYLIEEGQFIVFPPRVMHHSYGERDVFFKRLLIYFRPEEVLSPRVLSFFTKETRVCKMKRSAGKAIQQIIKALYKENKKGGLCCQEQTQLLLNLLLVNIMRNGQKLGEQEEKNVISEVIHYIYEHYQEEITLDELSRRFFLSPHYLCRKFKQTTGNTIIQYVHITRILHAQRLILETDMNFTQISKETGFSNLTHFNRVFRSVTGMSPSENRKEIRATM